MGTRKNKSRITFVCVLTLAAIAVVLVFPAESQEATGEPVDGSTDRQQISSDVRVRYASETVEISQAHYAQVSLARRRVTGSVSDAEFKRVQLELELAQLELKRVRTEVSQKLALARVAKIDFRQ